MPERDGLMRVFWPVDLLRTDSPGIIVGWRNSELDVFVLAILEGVEVSARDQIQFVWLTRFRHGMWTMP